MQTQNVDLGAALRAIGFAWHPEVGKAFNDLCTSEVRMRFKQNLFFLLKQAEVGPDDPKVIWRVFQERTNLSPGALEQIMHGVITPTYVGYVASCLCVDGLQMLVENFWENPFIRKAVRETA